MSKKQAYVFKHRAKNPEPDVTIWATSRGKAWKEFRRHHVSHAKHKDYGIWNKIPEGGNATDF